MKLTIAKKLNVFVLLMFVLILLISFFGIRGMYLTNKENDSMGSYWLPQRSHIDATNFFIQRTISLENMYVLSDSDKDREGLRGELKWTHDGLRDELQQIDKLTTSEEPREKFQNVSTGMEQYLANQEKALEKVDNGNVKEAKQILLDNRAIYKDVDANMYALVNYNQEKAQDSNKQSAQAYAQGRSVMILFVVLTVLVGIVGTIYLRKAIVGPLHKLNTVAQDVAAGNLVQEIDTNSNDEIGDLAKSLQSMSNHLRSLIMNLNEESAEVMNFAKEFSESSQRTAESSEQISSTVSEMAIGAEEQANHATSLMERMRGFSKAAVEAVENSNKLKSESNEMAGMTEKGYQQMQGTEAQMQEIYQVVHESVQKMAELDRNYQEVAKLVSTIQSISEQTNLLALNAAIEAARAGEHGKGFAVVADEVRKLSEQVADSVVEINQITGLVQKESLGVSDSLENSYKKVEEGSLQIKETSDTFKQISTVIDDVQTKITQLTNEIGTISEGASEVQSSIEHIAAISEQSSAGIEETAAVTEESSNSMKHAQGRSDALVELSERLQETTTQFRV